MRRCASLLIPLLFLQPLPACSDKTPTTPSEIHLPEPNTPDGPNALVVSWLRDHALPFDTPVVREDRSDLSFLESLIGDARIVSLGEATHGTREFFQMKHRILDYLAEEMGFRLFAMEATWPEMNRIDDWVHGGEGDPAVLLSGQYFWTWNTQEVMDLITWAREFNSGRPPEDHVSVLGFDMQYAGMAIHNVLTFLQRVDTAAASTSGEDYACYIPFTNGPSGRREDYEYDSKPDSLKDACRDGIDRVFSRLAENSVAWTAQTSLRAFAGAEHSARLVQQNEDMRAHRVPWARDRYMAENVEWILDQYGPASRIVLWAHNLHVSYLPEWRGYDLEWMGYHLRQRYGPGYLNVGFAFGSGSFNSRLRVGGNVQGVTAHVVNDPPAYSHEWHLTGAGEPRFFLDLRPVDSTVPGGTFLALSYRLRNIGAVYEDEPLYGFEYLKLTDMFDLLIFFRYSTPSVLLPFHYPTEW